MKTNWNCSANPS